MSARITILKGTFHNAVAAISLQFTLVPVFTGYYKIMCADVFTSLSATDAVRVLELEYVGTACAEAVTIAEGYCNGTSCRSTSLRAIPTPL